MCRSVLCYNFHNYLPSDFWICFILLEIMLCITLCCNIKPVKVLLKHMHCGKCCAVLYSLSYFTTIGRTVSVHHASWFKCNSSLIPRPSVQHSTWGIRLYVIQYCNAYDSANPGITPILFCVNHFDNHLHSLSYYRNLQGVTDCLVSKPFCHQAVYSTLYAL